jgi:selenocysteine lyase/cysteine desulfurase
VEDLEEAIDDKTAAVYFAATGWAAPGYLPLPQVIEVARRKGVPVVVDAAAQLPPVESLKQQIGLSKQAEVEQTSHPRAAPDY